MTGSRLVQSALRLKCLPKSAAMFESSMQDLQGDIAFAVNILLYCYTVAIFCYTFSILQVEPGKPGAEVSKKKNYKSKKEFAYRMCARRPTSAMPKPFLCCEPAFCCSMVVM